MDDGMLIGPGRDGDYGEGRARDERIRRHQLGLCQHCGRPRHEHALIRGAGGGELSLCPTAYYGPPVPLEKCRKCGKDEHARYSSEETECRYGKELRNAMKSEPAP